MKTRHIIAIIALTVCTAQAGAQGLWDRFYHGWLTKPRNVDSSYIYQQPMGFSPSLTGNFSRQTVKVTTTMDFRNFTEEIPILRFIYTDQMTEALSQRAGFLLAVGRLGAGWSFELAPDSSQHSSTFTFAFRGNKFGMNINYLDFSQQIIESAWLTPMGIFGDTISYDTLPVGNRLRRLTIDGFYVVNTRRFAYPPGIAGNLVQLRSAGSWMLAGRYMQSHLHLNPDYYPLANFGTVQFSIGCGYSYTWVPWSRAPRGGGRKMQSLFLNGTVVPMLTLFNHLTIDPYEELANALKSSDRRGIFCWPTPNILLNATVGYSWDRFYLGAQFNYNIFHFNTRNGISFDELYFPEEDMALGFMGILYEWNLGLKFQACF